MELGLTVIAMFSVGLGLGLAWVLWYVKREQARLDHRIDESLDAEDLVEFQERLQALLVQAGAAGAELVRTLDQRQAGVDKVLEKAREAELKLLARLHAMEKLAEGVARRLEAATSKVSEAVSPAKVGGKAKVKPSRPPQALTRPALTAPVLQSDPGRIAPETSRLDEAAAAEQAADEAARRSYLVRTPALEQAPARHQKIFDLIDRGMSREQISRETGVLAGELDLILNLRRQRRSKG